MIIIVIGVVAALTSSKPIFLNGEKNASEKEPAIYYECIILLLQWHALDKSEQAKYYELARKERAIHMQLYPGWSARDNYAQIGRKKKRPRDKNEGTYCFFYIEFIMERFKNRFH